MDNRGRPLPPSTWLRSSFASGSRCRRCSEVADGLVYDGASWLYSVDEIAADVSDDARVARPFWYGDAQAGFVWRTGELDFPESPSLYYPASSDDSPLDFLAWLTRWGECFLRLGIAP